MAKFVIFKVLFVEDEGGSFFFEYDSVVYFVGG